MAGFFIFFLAPPVGGSFGVCGLQIPCSCVPLPSWSGRVPVFDLLDCGGFWVVTCLHVIWLSFGGRRLSVLSSEFVLGTQRLVYFFYWN